MHEHDCQKQRCVYFVTWRQWSCQHHRDREQTHCELSSLFILFSSRMWRLRTLSRRSSSAWISASSYKWFKHTNTQAHKRNIRALTTRRGSSSKSTSTRLTSSVLNINGWLGRESVGGRLRCLFIRKTTNTSTNYRLTPSLERFAQRHNGSAHETGRSGCVSYVFSWLDLW